MIDVHLLTLPEDRQDWFDQCIRSLQGQPITLHVLAGIRGHIGRARDAGFSIGTNPYVSLVDPDDWVTPNGFVDCLSLLKAFPELDGAYTAEDQCYQDRQGWRIVRKDPQKGSRVHHLLVLKRSVYERYRDELLLEPQYPERRMVSHMARDGVKLGYTGTIGYCWRRYQKRFGETHGTLGRTGSE